MNIKLISSAFACAMLLASCGGQSQKAATEDASSAIEVVNPDIQRTWYIATVATSDTTVVRPAEIDAEHPQKFTFNADGSFGVTTNCNSLGGEYVHSGDSIALTNILSTQMACENMEVEQMLAGLLPLVNRVESVNDSTIRLTAPASAYVELTIAEPSVDK